MPFPSGEASVNRILSYSKGMSELGANMTVFSTNIGTKKSNTIDGIRYRSFRTNDFKSNIVTSLLILLINVLKEHKNIDNLILVSNSLFLIYPLFIICKIFGIKLIQEKSEFPFVLRKKSFFGVLFAKLYISTTYRLFDGLIIMTNPLFDYFKNKVNSKCKLIIIPMTVDVTRFDNVAESNEYGDYIAYCGDVGGNKDGLKNLIHAFSLVENKFPSIKLLLIGGTKIKEELEELKSYSQILRTKNIVFTGKVDRDLIPDLLSNSKMLVLARPSSLQSSGGFPTKLGEYLTTGKPVVVTKVGDIPFYLIDNENAFLVEPDNNQEFANKIKYVLNNYDLALTVGAKGKEMTQKVFNYKVQSKIMINFLNSFYI